MGLILGFFKGEELEGTVRDDVKTLKGVQALEGLKVVGWVYDVETGVVRELDV